MTTIPTASVNPGQNYVPAAAPEFESTVFDLLYNEYLPFRLYIDFMLGQSVTALGRRFGLSEHWVAERIEAVRLCMGKQVRINLLDSLKPVGMTQ